MSKSAKAGEMCAACREPMNEGASVCSSCQARRTVESGLLARAFVALVALGGLYALFLTQWSRTVGVGLFAAAAVCYVLAPRRIVYRHRR